MDNCLNNCVQHGRRFQYRRLSAFNANKNSAEHLDDVIASWTLQGNIWGSDHVRVIFTAQISTITVVDMIKTEMASSEELLLKLAEPKSLNWFVNVREKQQY